MEVVKLQALATTPFSALQCTFQHFKSGEGLQNALFGDAV
jgi:hypothetical protein